jgi:hypothetical protein
VEHHQIYKLKNYEEVNGQGIRANKLKDLIKFTEEVGDFSFCAKGQPQNHINCAAGHLQ